MSESQDQGKTTHGVVGDESELNLADRPMDEQRRRVVEKAIKVGAVAPVMLALFAGKKAAASGEYTGENF